MVGNAGKPYQHLHFLRIRLLVSTTVYDPPHDLICIHAPCFIFSNLQYRDAIPGMGGWKFLRKSAAMTFTRNIRPRWVSQHVMVMSRRDFLRRPLRSGSEGKGRGRSTQGDVGPTAWDTLSMAFGHLCCPRLHENSKTDRRPGVLCPNRINPGRH